MTLQTSIEKLVRNRVLELKKEYMETSAPTVKKEILKRLDTNIEIATKLGIPDVALRYEHKKKIDSIL